MNFVGLICLVAQMAYVNSTCMALSLTKKYNIAHNATQPQWGRELADTQSIFNIQHLVASKQ